MKDAIQGILRSAGLLHGGEVIEPYAEAIETVSLVEYKSKNAIALRFKCKGYNPKRFGVQHEVKIALASLRELELVDIGISDKTRKGSGFTTARGKWNHAVVESTTYSFYLRLRPNTQTVA